MLLLLIFVLGISVSFGEELSYDPMPMGTRERPLILRSFVPDPGLDPGVFANHGKAARSSKYSPKEGNDIKGDYEMIKLIPGAITVNHGPSLSYVWDTTECRMLYAWQGGFLDLFPYWGEEGAGARRSFDYSPRLVGNLFYLAEPALRAEPKYLGYSISKEGLPIFRFKLGEAEYAQWVEPVNRSFTFKISTARGGRVDRTIYTGELISRHQGYDRDLKIQEASVAAGERVFKAYGCIACHSADGSKGHGPSLKGLYGRMRPIVETEPVLADEAYLKESLTKPNAKTAEGFPTGYMPPYRLKDVEVASLMLFIKSLAP